MTAPKLSLTELMDLRPCDERLRVLEKIMPRTGRITASQARKAGATFKDIVWAAEAVAEYDKHTERALRMWTTDCAAKVLHIYEGVEQSEAPRKAIEASRMYAEGLIDDAARSAAQAAARSAARSAAQAAARDATWDATWGAARDATWSAAQAATRSAAQAAAWSAGEEWQFDRLCLWLSDEQPEPWPLTTEGKKQ